MTNLKMSRPMNSAAKLVIICCLLILKPLISHGAVIQRPTVFSDLPSDDQQASSQQQPRPAQHQLQSPQQQPINSNHWHQEGGQQQTTATTTAQKINPLKSRFCTGGPNNNQRLDHALGLHSGQIDDLSLSASSFSNEQVRPHLARLNQNLLGGAWCPGKPIGPSTIGQEWLQVNLNRSFVVSAIETQGRFALGSGKEFVPSYQIVYSRNNGQTWHKWKDFRGSSLLRANDDVNTAVRNELSPPIVGANVIRILPHSPHLRTVCLRLELFGCQYDEGAPIAYATNDGVVEPRWGHLIDYTYDGLRLRQGQLSGGLGQLVDGVKGPDNFSFNNGFEWVGWKSMNGDVVIEFTFKTLRNFTGALFHSNNLFSSGVEVFQSVNVNFGIDINLSMSALKDSLRELSRRQFAANSGNALSRAARQSDENDPLAAAQVVPVGSTVWSSDVLTLEYEPDKKVESARPVTVHLNQRLANKLRFTLKFASKWILLSEIEFLSHPVELMSLASLNEQQTPQLMADLRTAKSYGQYVAILRENQLKRIAADEFLGNVLGSTTSSAAGASTPTTSSPVSSQIQDQQQSDQQPPSEFVPELPMWSSDLQQQQPPSQAGPSTNPNLSNQPPYPAIMPTFPIDQQQQQQQQQPVDIQVGVVPQDLPPARNMGVATVISFVLVSLLAFAALLFAISSYRLRAIRRSGGPHGPTKSSFMGSVFANNSSASSGNGDSSAGSLHHTINFRHPLHHHHQMTLNHAQNSHTLYHNQLQQQHQNAHDQIRTESQYNPLFANVSNQSSDGSIKKSSSGPLSTLKKLAALSTRNLGASPTSKHQDLLFGNQLAASSEQRQNQLLVSLRDTITSGGKCKSSGKSQAINTQLIVGLNQANPLAHQQIYNQQQAIFGLQPGQQQFQTNPYASGANSMSLTSSSTLNGNQQMNAAGEYSLAASVDYATPDIQTSSAGQFNQPLPRQMFGGGGDAMRKHTITRSGSNRLQPNGQPDHNYEQISSEMGPNGDFRFTNTLHNQHHQRALSNQQQQQSQQAGSNSVCNNQQAFNSMTLGGGAFGHASRPPPRQQESSHYYYADTEAAKSCMGNS